MKNMKKVIIAILAIATVSTTALLPAMAEDATAPNTSASVQVLGRMGGRQGQMPGNNQQQMPGCQTDKKGCMPGCPNGQCGQQPGNVNGPAPDTQSNNAEAPDADAQNSVGMEAPAQQPGAPMDGQMPGAPANGQMPGMVDFDALVTDGTITQETRDAIDAYMRENGPKAPADSQDAPETGLLDDLLAANVITQEEYDAISAAQAEEAPLDQAAEAVAEAVEDATAEKPAE